MIPQRLSIFGVGLLGGSIGLAIKSITNDCKITGYGHRQASLEHAVRIGAIDGFELDAGKAVQEADWVILCTPVLRFEEILRQIAPSLKSGAIVTDVGSTKRSVVELAGKLLPAHARFVGSHPMAGSEKRGVEFARADLFNNALCILTPNPQTDFSALGKVDAFWKSLGMKTCQLDAAGHDQALAQVSHLPHALAACLVAMQSDQAMKLAGKGFLDTTRIAGGDGGLWRDIFLDNQSNMRAALAQLRGQLDQFEQLLDDPAALAQWLDAQAARREGVLRDKLGEVTPD